MSWLEILKAMGALAGLALAVLVGSKAWLSMKRTAEQLKDIERRLDEFGKEVDHRVESVGKQIEKQFLNMWFTAEQIGSARPAMIQELVGYETWDTSMVRGLIKSARQRVIILQTWFPEMEGDLDRWEFSYPEELKVEIFMACASNPAVLERVRFRKDFDSGENDQDPQSQVEKNVNACARRLRTLFEQTRKQHDRFSGKISLYKQGMPFGPIYIIDGLALVGCFPAQINCNAAPMLRLSAFGNSGKLYEESIRTLAVDFNLQVLYSTGSNQPSGKPLNQRGAVLTSAESAT